MATTTSTAATAKEGLVVDADRLLNLLRRQHGLYERLDGLAGEQSELIEQHSTQALLELLGRRGRLVEEQAKVRAQLEPYRLRWDEVLDRVGSARRGEVERLVAESERLLAGILERDRKDQETLSQAKVAAGSELGRVSNAGVAVRAYTASPGVVQNRYTNRQG